MYQRIVLWRVLLPVSNNHFMNRLENACSNFLHVINASDAEAIPRDPDKTHQWAVIWGLPLNTMTRYSPFARCIYQKAKQLVQVADDRKLQVTINAKFEPSLQQKTAQKAKHQLKGRLIPENRTFYFYCTRTLSKTT